MKNNEAVNEKLTTPVTPPATVIPPPPPPESRMLNIKEQKLDSTAEHLTASMEELLLLDPHKPLGYTRGSGSYRNLETTPIFDENFVLHYFEF